MKKRILLIITIVISMILCIDRVGAIEYTCENSNYYVTNKVNGSAHLQCCPNGFYYISEITQDVTYYICYSPTIKDKSSCKKAGGKWNGNKEECTADSKNALGKIKFENIKTGSVEKTCKVSGNICNVTAPTIENGDTNIFKGYSKSENCENIDYASGVTKINAFDTSTLYACYEKVYVICEYGEKFKIYYSKNTTQFFKENEKMFTSQHNRVEIYKEIMDSYYKNKTYCPPKIYYQSGNISFYSTLKSKGCPGLWGCKQEELTNSKILVKNEGNEEIKQPEEINDCKDLIGDKTRDLINSIMKWIRIAVPLLLIGLGIMDFSKGVFSSKEEDMKKSRERFIKRIIAALMVFLVPIFVNLVLDLANKAWSDINTDTCINK